MSRYQLIRSNGQALVFDLVNPISVSPSNRVTEHPIESGAPVTDHIQPLATEFTIVGTISETPLRPGASITGQAALDHARAFFEDARLELLVFDGPRVGTIANLALVRWPHEFTEKRSLTFNIGLRQVRIAEAATVFINTDAIASDSGTDTDGDGVADIDFHTLMTLTADYGEMATTDTSTTEPASTEEDSSTLYDLMGLEEEEAA